MKRQTPSSAKPTIIIAAFNEAAVIRRTLNLLTAKDHHQQYQILVVCNGCTDNTEQIICQEFKNVICISLTQASKALAIRHAESLQPGFPRLYLDADIELSSYNAVSLIQLADDHSTASLVVPGSEVVTQGCERIVKRYYRAWYQTPYVKCAGYGSGTYLLNRSGRSRFGTWPDLTADDAFVRSQFAVDEVHISAEVRVKVMAPKTFLSLVKIKARSKYGNMELRNHLVRSGTNNRESGGHKSTCPASTREKIKPFDKLAYILVNACALIIATWHFKMGKKLWLRDNSNR